MFFLCLLFIFSFQEKQDILYQNIFNLLFLTNNVVLYVVCRMLSSRTPFLRSLFLKQTFFGFLFTDRYTSAWDCAIQAIIAITVEKNLQSSLYFAVKKTNIIGRKDLFNQFKVYLFFKTNDVVLYVECGIVSSRLPLLDLCFKHTFLGFLFTNRCMHISHLRTVKK